MLQSILKSEKNWKSFFFFSASPSDVPICKKSPIRFPIRSQFFFFFLYFPIRGSLSRTICCNPFWNRRKIEKVVFFFLKVKNHENHRNDLSCQIVILRGVFHFLYPKLFFSYISRHVLSDYVNKKKSIIWRYIAKMRSRSPLKNNQITYLRVG